MENTDKHCLNCGTQLTDAFCPHCGQKASVGRLSLKTAIIDNTWSVLRMDKRVLPTSLMLLTRPWVVVRDYIHGHRVMYTQPVRLIVIMCFVNLILQMFMPGEAHQPEASQHALAQSMGLQFWHAVQAFLRDSRVAMDLIDSAIFAPIVYLMYMPWGSRRFNMAEYSTAYLYLCAAGLIMDVVTMPLSLINGQLDTFVQMIWWIYLLNGMVKHAFHFKHTYTRILMLVVNIVVITLMWILTAMVFLGRTL